MLMSTAIAIIAKTRSLSRDSSALYSWSELVGATDELHPPGWRLLVDVWLDSFGLAEAITRWFSKLVNLLTFALLYQLGKQVCGRRVGLYAIVLLGVYGFAASAMYELRPYPLLITLVTALHLIFFRWMRKPSSNLTFAYTFAGIAAIYTHYFSVFVFPAHAVCLALFARYERKLWLNSILMWVFIALVISGLAPALSAGDLYRHAGRHLLRHPPRLDRDTAVLQSEQIPTGAGLSVSHALEPVCADSRAPLQC